jgi:pyrroloquinoline quinone (PQQ) biosynthesis protein C
VCAIRFRFCQITVQVVFIGKRLIVYVALLNLLKEVVMDIVVEIKKLESRKELNQHSLIQRMRKETFSKEQVAVVLGQWFHPLHYFPSFVSRYIGICPDMVTKTLMSKLVWQELGEGDPKRAHEVFFINTMQDAGFTLDQFLEVEAFPATVELVSEYKDKSGYDHLASLGYVYATESADLLMVSSIGSAVRKATDVKRLPWVDIHVSQEPDHTDCVDHAVANDLSAEECNSVLASADSMFKIWCEFFSSIEAEMDNLGTTLNLKFG